MRKRRKKLLQRLRHLVLADVEAQTHVLMDAVVAESAEEGKAAGLRFYRAEPVPPTWGSSDLPDTWDGGRWGPPYALLQGTLKPQGSTVKAAKADAGEGARPVVRRGMLAWAGGGGGPDFFCALADHPEVRRPRTSAHIASTHAAACLLCPITHSQRSARARQSCSRPRLVGQRTYRVGGGAGHDCDRRDHATASRREELGEHQRD